MKTAFLLAALTLSSALFSQAQDGLNIATVDMKQLVKDYWRTEEAQQSLNEKQALLTKNNNEKQAQIREIEDEIDKLRKQITDGSLTEAKKAELYRQLEGKQQEGVAMSRTLQEFIERKRRQLSDETQRQMRGIMEEIRKLVEEKATAGDYDYVFDKTGNSTTLVPVLLYSKDAVDITESLLTELNKNAPAEE